MLCAGLVLLWHSHAVLLGEEISVVPDISGHQIDSISRLSVNSDVDLHDGMLNLDQHTGWAQWDRVNQESVHESVASQFAIDVPHVDAPQDVESGWARWDGVLDAGVHHLARVEPTDSIDNPQVSSHSAHQREDVVVDVPEIPSHVTSYQYRNAGSDVALPCITRHGRCRNGYGANLNRVPFFVGDGCGPGASSSQLSAGRATWIANELVPDAGTQLLGVTGVSNSLLYNLPNNPSVETIGGGIIPPPSPIAGYNVPEPTTIGSTIPVQSGVGGTLSFDGNAAQIAQGQSYEAGAQNYFETVLFPGSSGVTAFNSGASGAIETNAGEYSSFAYYDYLVDTTMLTPGYNVGFVKLTENVSPLPRDRVYMNYSYFHNAFFSPQYRQNINRFMPGFEKTFWDGWTSIEVRTPFAATLDATQTQSATSASGLTNADSVQFGNLSVIFKSVIQYGKTWALTGGTQVMCPTAGDVSILNASGQTQVFVDNQSTHVMPFVGFIWAPNSRFFSQSILQVDIDANGNPVWANATQGNDIFAAGNFAGRLNYPTFLYASFGGGYWVYQDNSRSARLTGIAPLMEVHVNQTLSNYDCIDFDNYTLGSDLGSTTLVNGLVGVNFEWGLQSTLTVAYATPLGGGVDRWFDGELRAFYNWRFGPQTRLTRVQF